MLEETRGYLMRLPAVPVTYELILKLNKFLDNPDNTLLAQRKVPRGGALRAPVGYPIVSAELRGNTLSLWRRPALCQQPNSFFGL